MKRKILVGTGLGIASLLTVVAVLFVFGIPQDSSSGSGEVAIGTQAPPPDPSSPLAIEIPGCVCHSEDAEVVREHATYRMNQCVGCHVGGTPGMGR